MREPSRSVGELMPTAAEYTIAATRLEALAASVNQLTSTLREAAQEPGLDGGFITQLRIEIAMGAGLADLSSGQSAMYQTAADLKTRALICQRYSDDMREYLKAVELYEQTKSTGPRPVRPVKPFPWVEE